MGPGRLLLAPEGYAGARSARWQFLPTRRAVAEGWAAGSPPRSRPRAVEQAGVSTLGVDSDNMMALRPYDDLGYRTAHRWHTRSLAAVAGEGRAPAYD